MVFSIGIISAKSSLAHIQSSLSSRKSATYQFHYFPYSPVDEVPQIYKEHECDGFVFSGSRPITSSCVITASCGFPAPTLKLPTAIITVLCFRSLIKIPIWTFDASGWIAQFNRELGGGMILRNYANSTEILTSNSTLRCLTRNGSRSQLTDYLRQNCATAFSLGWGVGLNVLQAQQNANRSINESLRDPSHGTYLIDENDRLTGPLGAEGCRTFSTRSSQEAQLLAQRIGLSLTNAERLLEVSRNQLNMRVTRNDLSLYLNATPRTANRILNRLTELGAAVAVGTEQNNSAGPSAPIGWSCKSCSPRKPEFHPMLCLFIALSGTFHSYL